MGKLKVSVEVSGLRLPLRKALHTAARLGAAAAEIDARGEISPQQFSQTALRQLRKMLEDLGLRVSALRFRTRRGYDTTEALEPRIAATKATMQLAYALGARVVVNQLGRAAAEPDSPQRRLLVEVLEDLGRHGQRVGALLAADTGSESGPQLAGLLAQLPHGAIGADLTDKIQDDVFRIDTLLQLARDLYLETFRDAEPGAPYPEGNSHIR